jgi:hypothetical protein
MTAVDVSELLEAVEFVSSVLTGDAAAYVSRDTGDVYFVGTDMEPEDGLPEDLETSDRYVAVPSKQDLDLGRPLALRFAETHVPEHYEAIFSVFSRPGAYARFKNLLETHGRLAAWYEFENKAQQDALRDWCAAEGLELTNSEPDRLASR